MNRLLTPTILALAATASSQVAPLDDRGPFQAFPIFVRHTAHTELQHRSAGSPGTTTNASASQTIGGVTTPGLRLQDLFPALNSHQLGLVNIDAISSGNDHIPATANHRIDPVAGGTAGWATILFSVSGNAQGPSGSIINARITNRDADIFSYTLPNSILPIPLVGQTFLEIGYETMGMATGSVFGLDMHLPWIQAGVGGTNVAPYDDDIFFSLTTTSASDFIAAYGPLLHDSGNGALISSLSGADILHIHRNSGAWERPTVFRTAAELLHEDLQPGDDIDALAVDLRTPASGIRAILFSLKDLNGTPRPQLMLQVDPTAKAKRPKNHLDQELLIVLAGEVDAISVVDPETNVGNRHAGWVDDKEDDLALSMANNGPLGTPLGTFHIAVDGFRRSHGAGLVRLEARPQGLQTWFQVGSQQRGALQDRVEWQANLSSLFQQNQRVRFRVRFTDGESHLTSWSLLFQDD